MCIQYDWDANGRKSKWMSASTTSKDKRAEIKQKLDFDIPYRTSRTHNRWERDLGEINLKVDIRNVKIIHDVATDGYGDNESNANPEWAVQVRILSNGRVKVGFVRSWCHRADQSFEYLLSIDLKILLVILDLPDVQWFIFWFISRRR